MSARDQNDVLNQVFIQSLKVTAHTEMSMSARLRITFAALNGKWLEIMPRTSASSVEEGRDLTHQDFQAFPWPSFGS
jgi:hypothetical protein